MSRPIAPASGTPVKITVEGLPPGEAFQLSQQLGSEINRFVYGARQNIELGVGSSGNNHRTMSDGTVLHYANNQGSETVRVVVTPPQPPEPAPEPEAPREPEGPFVLLVIDIQTRGTSWSTYFRSTSDPGAPDPVLVDRHVTWADPYSTLAEIALNPDADDPEVAANARDAGGDPVGTDAVRFAGDLPDVRPGTIDLPDTDADPGGEWVSETPHTDSFVVRVPRDSASLIEVRMANFRTEDGLDVFSGGGHLGYNVLEPRRIRVRRYAETDALELVRATHTGGEANYTGGVGWEASEGLVMTDRAAVGAEWTLEDEADPYGGTVAGAGVEIALLDWTILDVFPPLWVTGGNATSVDFVWPGPDQVRAIARITYEGGEAEITVL